MDGENLDAHINDWLKLVNKFKVEETIARRGGDLDLFLDRKDFLEEYRGSVQIQRLAELEKQILNLEFQICQLLPTDKGVQLENGLTVRKRPRDLNTIFRTSPISTRYLEEIIMSWV